MRIALGRWMIAAIALAAWMPPAWSDAPSARPNSPVAVESAPEPAASNDPPAKADDIAAPTDEPTDQPDAASPVAPNLEHLRLGSAADGSDADRDTNAPNTHSGSWVLQTLMALGIVLALIFLLRAVLKRLAGPNAPSSRGGLVEVLARTSIAPKTCVLFLKINDRIVVAAQGPTGIDTLTTLDDPEDVARILAQVSAAQPASITSGFRKLLQRADAGYDDRPFVDDEGGDDDEQFFDRTRDQLTSLVTRIRGMGARSRNDGDNNP